MPHWLCVDDVYEENLINDFITWGFKAIPSIDRWNSSMALCYWQAILDIWTFDSVHLDRKTRQFKWNDIGEKSRKWWQIIKVIVCLVRLLGYWLNRLQASIVHSSVQGRSVFNYRLALSGTSRTFFGWLRQIIFPLNWTGFIFYSVSKAKNDPVQKNDGSRHMNDTSHTNSNQNHNKKHLRYNYMAWCGAFERCGSSHLIALYGRLSFRMP